MGRRTKRKSKPSHGHHRRDKDSPQIERNVKPPPPGPAVETPIAALPRLLPIGDRLVLPPYLPDDLPEDDGNPELQLVFRPRAYFVPSLCLACSRPCSGPSSCCPGCRMVAYCSEEHRQRDAAEHSPLCRVLREVCRWGEGGAGGLAAARGLGPEEFRRLRLELLQRVAEGLGGRPLEPREREIVLYPRLCRVCRKDDEGLVACGRCGMELFCTGAGEGEGENGGDKEGIRHRGDHEVHCLEFRVFRRIAEMQQRFECGGVAPKLPDFRPWADGQLPANMDELLREIFGRDVREYQSIDCAAYATLAQAASPPLTALYAFRELDLLARDTKPKSMRIDVIGAELQFECVNVSLWEKLFLHLLPSVESLTLEFCGPELLVPDEIANLLRRPPVCGSCRARRRTLDVVFHSGKLYHQVESEGSPDLVCLFNPGLYRTTGFDNQDTWPATIDKFCRHGSPPVLITSYTEVELPRDLARLRSECAAAGGDSAVEALMEPRRNPFASLKPERNFVSDDVAPLIYKNYYVAVVEAAARRER